jgi:hypothetical protein
MESSLKKVAWVVFSVIFLATLVGCDKEGEGDKGNIFDRIIGVTQVEDLGVTGKFDILLNFAGSDGGKVFWGQKSPGDASEYWVQYPVASPNDSFPLGLVRVEWPKGQPFEFAYGAGEERIDPSRSRYIYGDHFRLFLGKADVCEDNNIGDFLISDIVDLGGGVHRVFLNFPDNLPIQNYQEIAVYGQSAPNSGWIQYPVTDNHPCYYVDVVWEGDSLFEFSFWVIREDGVKQWVDPTDSEFLCGDHLCVNF